MKKKLSILLCIMLFALSGCRISGNTKLSLAPELGATTALSMGRDLRTGEVEAIEIFNQIPGQMSVNDVIDQEEEDPQKAFDPDTGEIYEPSNKVIDLRKAKQA